MDKLPDRFNDFLRKHCLIAPSGKLLLAVSGGIDSMVMMHLFHQSGHRCEVAHCNFQLRGDDSDADETFVQQQAHLYNFPFHVHRFLTEEYAVDKGLSIQMAARDLRYSWFEELMEKSGFSAVAVGHHANDIAETMLLNLVKGTGIAGMHGIQPVNGKVIRPLLFATKNELEAYAAHFNIGWRADASNLEVYYQRNKIRHEVIPLLEEINPDLTGAMRRHAKLMSGYEALIDQYISQLEAVMVHRLQNGNIKSVLLKPLMESPAPAIVLYHFLKMYGVGGAMCDEMLATTHVGAEFYSNGFKIVRDRDSLTIFDPTGFTDKEIQLQESDQHSLLPFGKLKVEVIHRDPDEPLQSLTGFTDINSAYIDAAQLKFPMVIRRWRAGDTFRPLGMKGNKLLSDFLTDAKFSSAAKEVVYLLMSDDRVVWVIGQRIDDRFKISKNTKKTIRFSYTPHEHIR